MKEQEQKLNASGADSEYSPPIVFKGWLQPNCATSGAPCHQGAMADGANPSARSWSPLQQEGEHLLPAVLFPIIIITDSSNSRISIIC